jgi:hypothetical protein
LFLLLFSFQISNFKFEINCRRHFVPAAFTTPPQNLNTIRHIPADCCLSTIWSASEPAEIAEDIGQRQKLLSFGAKNDAIAIVEKRAAENRGQNFNRY